MSPRVGLQRTCPSGACTWSPSTSDDLLLSNLGLATVLWPAILYDDEEEGLDIIVPDNVDEFALLALAPATANTI